MCATRQHDDEVSSNTLKSSALHNSASIFDQRAGSSDDDKYIDRLVSLRNSYPLEMGMTKAHH